MRVSAIGLGCGTIGGVGSAPSTRGRGMSEAEGIAMLDRAADLGINLLDTANAYAGGDSERVLGRWFAARGPAARDRIVLCTKVRNPVGPEPADAGLSRRHIRTQVEESLRRLQTDRIDLYLSHAPDPETPLEETLGAFDELVRRGKARAFGACNVTAELAAESLAISAREGFARCACVQNEYNLLEPRDERELHPLCEREGLAYVAFSPLCGGLLSGKYRGGRVPEGSRLDVLPGPYRRHRTERVFRSVEALQTAAEARGVSAAGLALAWVRSNPRVTAPLVAPRRPEQFRAVEEALALRLGPEDRAALAALFAR